MVQLDKRAILQQLISCRSSPNISLQTLLNELLYFTSVVAPLWFTKVQVCSLYLILAMHLTRVFFQIKGNQRVQNDSQTVHVSLCRGFCGVLLQLWCHKEFADSIDLFHHTDIIDTLSHFQYCNICDPNNYCGVDCVETSRNDNMLWVQILKDQPMTVQVVELSKYLVGYLTNTRL